MKQRVTPNQDEFQDILHGISGFKSQRILHQKMLEIIGNRLKCQDVFEAGCGRGAFTKKILAQEPRSVLVADINLGALEKVSQLDTDLIRAKVVDLSSKLELETSAFDWVICSSVLMHLAPNESKQAIKELLRVTKASGHIMVAVLHEDFAKKNYQSAPEYGDCAWEVSKNQDIGSLIEYYPEPEHYLEPFLESGLSVEECIVDQDGQPYWRVYHSGP